MAMHCTECILRNKITKWKLCSYLTGLWTSDLPDLLTFTCRWSHYNPPVPYSKAWSSVQSCYLLSDFAEVCTLWVFS